MRRKKILLTSPNVSIIIPTYNNARYILDALESVFSQSYDSYEVIIIDDGSTDETRTVLEPFSHRIKYIFQNHTGVSGARNKGLSLALGKYVVFLDSDDFFHPDKIIKQATFLDSHPEVGLVHSGWNLINEEKKLIAVNEPWIRTPILDLKAWLVWQPIFLGAIMFRKTWLKKVNGFDISLSQGEDTDFLLRLSLQGCPAVWLKETTIYYRQHNNSLTSKSVERIIYANKVIEKFFSLPEIPERIQQLEKNVRYHILMWSVWLLYRSGDSDKIATYLNKTLDLINGSPKHIIYGWIWALIQYCRQDQDYNIGELRNFWPYIKEVMRGEEKILADSEKLFYWLLQAEMQLKSHERDNLNLGSEVIK